MMAKKKLEYQRALEDQIREKAERKEREKRAKQERELREEREAANYNPWGKGGGGAPVKDDRGNVVTNLKDMRHDANDRRDNPDAYRSPPPRARNNDGGGGGGYGGGGGHGGDPHRPSTPPRHQHDQQHPGGGGGGDNGVGGGGGGGADFQGSPRFHFRSDNANMLPHEMEARIRPPLST